MKKALFCLLMLNVLLAYSQQRIVIAPINFSVYIGTYNIDYIRLNKVKTMSVSYRNNYMDSTQTDIMDYIKYFNREGEEQKVVGFYYNKPVSVDSIVIRTTDMKEVFYSKKNRKFKPSSRIYYTENQGAFPLNSPEIKQYGKSGWQYLRLYTDKYGSHNSYEWNKKSYKFLTRHAHDSLHNITTRIIPDDYEKKLDTFTYQYHYDRLLGVSIIYKANVKYLHSIITLNNNKQVALENIFDIEYDKVNINMAGTLSPNTVVTYHYLENGLNDTITIDREGGERTVYFFQYEYYD